MAEYEQCARAAAGARAGKEDGEGVTMTTSRGTDEVRGYPFSATEHVNGGWRRVNAEFSKTQ
jgi:hypothetical protein